MVNQKRVAYHLAKSDLYPLRGSMRESVLHALRDCTVVRPVWLAFLPSDDGPSFFSWSCTLGCCGTYMEARSRGTRTLGLNTLLSAYGAYGA